MRCVDTECYKNFWLCSFDNPPQSFQMFPGHPLDTVGLRRELSKCCVVTFNGQHYDVPMISLAIHGVDNGVLKGASDAIILQGLKSWEFARAFNITLLPLDHIDLFDVLPGEGSLKMYGGKMHAKKLQDLPFDPAESIDWPKRVLLREYCDIDLSNTRLALGAMKSQLALREQMSAEYGVDLRSKSDAQIAEAVMKTLLTTEVIRPAVTPGAQFYFRPAPWLEFVTTDLLGLLARNPFTITESGGIEPAHELASTVVRFGSSAYKMGTGGLHSMEQSMVWQADASTTLLSPDVAAYYPSLIVRLGIYPAQIGPDFQTHYAGWKTRRDKAKAAGDKKTANSLKTLNNGTFGKLGSKYSIFYAPKEFVQVTLTGQLALLMLIERMELCGLPVISANTDGIVVKCRNDQRWLYDELIRWWENRTGFVMETSEFRLLASRDVNSYVAIGTDGKVKTKGAYAPPEPGASGWPNPTTQVCVDAVVAYLRDGTPLSTTILACTDVRQFVSVRKVKGGGSYAPHGALARHTTQIGMRTALGWPPGVGTKEQLYAAYASYVSAQAMTREYLGKAVRWYMSRDCTGCIVTGVGNKVAKTDGCRPLMELPDSLPADLDYMWYVAEARALLADLGVTAP